MHGAHACSEENIVICCTLSVFSICCISPQNLFVFCALERMKNHEMQYIAPRLHVSHSRSTWWEIECLPRWCLFRRLFDHFHSLELLAKKNFEQIPFILKMSSIRAEQAMGISDNNKFVAFSVYMRNINFAQSDHITSVRYPWSSTQALGMHEDDTDIVNNQMIKCRMDFNEIHFYRLNVRVTLHLSLCGGISLVEHKSHCLLESKRWFILSSATLWIRAYSIQHNQFLSCTKTPTPY